MKNKAVIFMMSMVLAMGECSASPCRYRDFGEQGSCRKWTGSF